MKNKQVSESILQKRIKRFKSMKRGYYSLILLIIFYVLSILGPLWMNNKALIVKYNNEYYFPAVMEIKWIESINFSENGSLFMQKMEFKWIQILGTSLSSRNTESSL